MTDAIATGIGYDDGDVDTNLSSGATLGDLVAQRYSRRDTIRNGVGAMAMAVFGSSVLAACDNNSDSVTPTDPAPTVTVGSTGAASTGNNVTITGTASDNGTVTSTTFVQVSGPAVNLSATTGLTTSFIAPAVATATPVVIRFTANDNSGGSSSADAQVNVSPAQLSFTAVPKNKNDIVTVPAGYTVSVLYRTGDPISAATPAYKNDGTDTDFSTRIGDHGDALQWFGLTTDGARDDASSTRGILVQNFENINQQYLHAGPATPAPRPESEALKEIEAHGVGITELAQTTGVMAYVQGSNFNRRITPNTPVVFSGPVKGSDFLKTAFSPDGTQGRGTLNNCANGVTPWGSALTCEENWAGYFRRPPATDNPRRTAKEVTALTRYAVTTTGNFGWATVTPANPANTSFARFDVQATGASATADFRNEHNQFGWVVEIDPYDKTKTPKKRTAMGRMNHEGAWPSRFVAGLKPAFYMGDDAVNEYLYKFVSGTVWASADAAGGTDRLTIGDKYLDTGTLYVAQFKADGTGTWLPLTFGTAPLTAANAAYPFADQIDVLTNARLAGDALGATKMDRPEWTAVNPITGEVYLTLTNNSSRTPATTDAANPRAYVDPPATSIGNRNGHIIRLRETGDTSEAVAFTWDIFLFGAGSDLDPTNINVSGLTADNDFSSPDGLAFARPSSVAGSVKPLLWIETDDNAYLDASNCMMLAALPGNVGDGGDAAAKTIVNKNADGTTVSTATKIGKAQTTNLKRFLVGPVEAEITGVDSTPDGRTLFVGIQHPGEGGTAAAPTSHWPATQATGTDATGSRPRSATIVIRRTDGGIVGL